MEGIRNTRLSRHLQEEFGWFILRRDLCQILFNANPICTIPVINILVPIAWKSLTSIKCARSGSQPLFTVNLNLTVFLLCACALFVAQ